LLPWQIRSPPTDGQASRGTAQPSAADGFLGSDGVRLAWGGAGDQRATGTQADGEPQALRQWGEEGGSWEMGGLVGYGRGLAGGISHGGLKRNPRKHTGPCTGRMPASIARQNQAAANHPIVTRLLSPQARRRSLPA